MYPFFPVHCPLAELPRPVILIYTAGGLQTYTRSTNVTPPLQQFQTSEDTCEDIC